MTDQAEIKTEEKVSVKIGDWEVTNFACNEDVDIKLYDSIVVSADSRESLSNLRFAIEAWLETSK